MVTKQFLLYVLHKLYICYHEQVEHHSICQQLVHRFEVGLLCLISLQYYFSLILHLVCTRWFRFMLITHAVKKSKCCWWGGWAAWQYYQPTQSIHIDGMTVTSLYLSLLEKVSVHLFQTVLSRKLSYKFEKLCKHSHITVNLCKIKHACTWIIELYMKNC